ncbi:hypothetical protein F4815DRAFT_307709 [Daldinia loculata]|nr:hypothetical protein F4815DRAFT_307709 [Daldinia loculata]
MYVLCCIILGSLVIRYIKIALTSGWAIDELTVSRTRSSCLWVYRLVLSVSHIGKYMSRCTYSYRLKPYQTTPVTQRISNGFNCRDTSRGKRGKKAIWSLLRSVYAIMSPIYWLHHRELQRSVWGLSCSFAPCALLPRHAGMKWANSSFSESWTRVLEIAVPFCDSLILTR